METNDNVEILVHVTAPCRTVDDARYRALAQAYLAFKPGSQTKILSAPSLSNASIVIPSSQAEPVALPTWSDAPIPSSEATQPQTSSPPAPSRISFRSPELSFRSVLDNINSPGLARTATSRDVVPSSQPETESQRTQASWQAPPSVVGDSQPLNTISLAEFSSPSRLFEHLACQFDSQADGESQQASPETQPRIPRFPTEAALIPEKYAEEEEGVDDDDGQVVLVTASDSPTVRSEVLQDPASSAENIILGTPFPPFKRPPLRSSPYEQVVQDTPCQPSRKRHLVFSPTRAGSEPLLPSKRHKRSAPISESRSMIRSSSDVGPVTSELYRPNRPPNERHLSYLERLEIHPVGPPVGTTDLTTDDLLTPKLRELAQQLNISKRYSPVEQKRELRSFERGHWQLDWTDWRPTLRERAWHFLTDYILEGFAGWGVWCKRAEDWSWLRVYCWGHIVGHVYLALYLASERALKKDGARWVDGAGEVIVITNGHENSESGESMGDRSD
ncbi:hypothetical protein EsH8_I_001082 [Colletotrichum jinshuiense]